MNTGTRERKNKGVGKNAVSRLLVEKTDLGWISVVFRGPAIAKLQFGFKTVRDAVRAMDSGLTPEDKPTPSERVVLRKLVQLCRGKNVNLQDVVIDTSQMTPFQKSVTRECRKIAFGETRAYGELARLAGAPGAARAVGSVMSSNRVPLVVPCHRVIGSGGSPGGYSAVDGIVTKEKLLRMEGVEL